MKLISELHTLVKVGDATTRHNMSVFPLFAGWAQKSHVYVPFGVAHSKGLVSITEVSQGGSVPTLSVRNLAPMPVLLIDGEELIGAKQNRIVNLSILIPAETTMAIPVSCVESGRWNYSSPNFVQSDRAMYARGRARKMMDVNQSMKSGSRASNQSAVWADIGARYGELDIDASPTSAMSEIFESKRASLDEYLAGVSAAEDQVGAAFAINGSLVGFELFEAADVFSYYLPKILRSYAVEALTHLGRAFVESPEKAQVNSLLSAVSEATPERFPALGYGEDVRLDAPSVTGAALVADESVVHLVGFSKKLVSDSPMGTPNRSPRPSRRTSLLIDPPPRDSGAARGRRPEQRQALRIIHNHMLLEVEGKLALIDTGSPISMGRGNLLQLEGRRWTPSQSGEGVLDIVSEHLNTPVEWLLGYDILSAHRMLIDWPNSAARIGGAIPRRTVTTSIPIETVMGVPLIDASFGGRGIRAVLDSGAALSYAPRAAVQGLTSVGTYTDFYPGIGVFETETWNVEVHVGERAIQTTVGVLPEMLQTMFGLLLGDNGWILGVDFFRNRRILLDYARHRVLDVAL